MTVLISDIAAERVAAAGSMEPTQGTIDLVFASDWKYLPYTAVTLVSLLRNYKGIKPVRVFILIGKLMRDEDRQRFESLKSIHTFELVQIPVDAKSFEKIRTSAGISVATYYRLVMHNLLPADVRKILYLDSDLVVQSSIDELFETKFDGAIFCGVEDSLSAFFNRRFGIPPSGRHINAGVLLVNVDLMREINFDHLIEEYLEANKYRIVLGDQQILNELFFNAIKYVPLKWNVHGSMFIDGWADVSVGIKNGMDKTEALEAIADPAIIHYTLRRKPWISMDHPKSKTWFDYLRFTPWAADIQEPDTRATSSKAMENGVKPKKKRDAAHFLTKVVPGTVRSIARLRHTRLQTMELAKKIAGLEKRVSARPGVKNILAIPQGDNGAKDDLDIKLKQIISAIAQRAPETFSAGDVVAAVGEHANILANVHQGDIEGGYNENLKTALRTADIRYSADCVPRAVVLVSQRLKQGMFWQCIETAYLYDLPLYFVEVALFGAFASYFDEEATLNEKRAFGFMIDDMGYYYDARQPSRLEQTLNDSGFTLSEAERSRSRGLIDRIVADNITKYNKYCGLNPSFEIEEGAILVVGQKRGDASIEFAGANDGSFDRMLDAAVAECGGRTVYYKRHPDAILGGREISARFGDDVVVLPDDVSIGSIIERCDVIYTVSSQVGFEGLLRGKKVVTFGMPFYAGWGLTDDRCRPPRRTARRTVEDLFHVACIQLSVYVDGITGRHIELEQAIDMVLELRAACVAGQRESDCLPDVSTGE